MEIRERVALRDFTFWKIGGEADFFCLPENADQVREAILFARTRGLPITVLGGGTNVLVSDRGVEGLVIGMKMLTGVDVEERDGRLHVGALAGTPKSELTREFLKRRLAPALFLCGLPGDVGGGVVMNAGVSEKIAPREFVEITEWVEFFGLNQEEPHLARASRDQLKWTYRSTVGWQPGVIVRAGFSWPLAPDAEIPGKVKAATKSRLERQPLEMPSCGSTFKNPPGQAAGALIDQAGLKGFQAGKAQVSPKHANFIVNLGGATAADVQSVIMHVRGEVKRRFGVDLETEVKLMGRW